ncbi:MAG: ABC-F family ATP-binding cassette domain-containing protein, partial [Chloroflexi bacterium]|nr:ABC-F family ATP-binding cassette domain-containing protein [Chloroflexota bacterium]
MLVRVDNVIKDYGGQRVLRGASLALRSGERAALLGANGGGKSTLLKIIAGLEEPDDGRVQVPAGAAVGYLPQDAGVQPGRSLHDEVLSAVADLLEIENELRRLEARIEARTGNDGLEELVHTHAELQEEFERRGGYAIEAEVGRVLAGLGFSEADRSRRTEEFSGGWQMRIALARLLLGRPDILLLDEPTNHLDLAATEWLEGYVKASRATMLIVSHDRYFLDAVIQRVFELRDGQIESFPAGNYSAYRVERALRDEQLENIAQRQQEEIERVEAYIRRYKEGNRATMAKSREKMLARLEAARVSAPRQERMLRFTFPACPPSGREVVTLSKVTRAYGPRVVLQDVTLTIERGEHVALIGPNGAGKSTLLRVIAGRDRPTRGSASFGVGVRPAYFAQDQAEHLDPANTVFDEVYQAAPASWDIQAVRDLLGRFLFSGEAQFKAVAGLSGGERSRVALAKLLLRPNNLLLLDEPTNHLDVNTRERLEETLSDYTGTLVLATHDRYLVDRLATRVVEVADGGVHVFEGGYSAYLRAKAAAPVAPVAPQPAQVVVARPRAVVDA